MRRQLPLLHRFTVEILPQIGKRRLAICRFAKASGFVVAANLRDTAYIGDFIEKSVIPIAQNAARYDLAQVTIEAIGIRQMNWPRAIAAISQDLGSYVLEQVRHPLYLLSSPVGLPLRSASQRS